MSYGRGKCTGVKRERQPRKSTVTRLEAMGKQIEAYLRSRTRAELVASLTQPVR